MTNARRLRMPPAAAYYAEKFRRRAERLRRKIASGVHALWLHGLRRVERCVAARRRKA
jgi:hypothetical protein